MDFILGNLRTIILIALAVVILVLIIKNYQKIKSFLLEVKLELSKVAWSTRKELMASTVLVITVTGIMTIFIGMVDLGLSRFLSVVFK
ncbi:MAG: preprotein translocase subunit SecE [Candidatus Omnitrophica bacterium]|nr:preprotein translocase subunit SecE [Candidatus Omnitrophota bacterium]MBU1922688.1 preprotein translocase subunit SecE [Candidatus Omnitrophota bacterium]